MKFDQFLHDLHFDVDKVRPVDITVDWDDAPLPYKLYRNCPVFPLSAEVLLTLRSDDREQFREGDEADQGTCVSDGLASVSRELVGQFLWYTYGLTQLCETTYAVDTPENASEPVYETMYSLRRFVPSGGGLYPNELYVYLKTDGLPSGIYHYDVAHHRLVLLREGAFDEFLTRALGNRVDVSNCFGVAFVTTMFWKNYFKYNQFAYRLQGLDAGVLLGQLVEVAKHFGLESTVCFDFLDHAIQHLLALREGEESVYAVIPISTRPARRAGVVGASEVAKGLSLSPSPVEAAGLCRELPPIHLEHYVKSKKVRSYQLLLDINAASVRNSTAHFGEIHHPTRPATHQDQHEDQHQAAASIRSAGTPAPLLNKADAYDFAQACRRRYSPGLDFVAGQVSAEQLVQLFDDTINTCSYTSDAAPAKEFVPGMDAKQDDHHDIQIACCVHGVRGLTDGAYLFDARGKSLHLLRAGDHRTVLQFGMSMYTVNLFQVPVCVHLVGDRRHGTDRHGYRGYRIEQMRAGILLQHLLLHAADHGLGGHPLLGYDAITADEIYGLEAIGRTCLIQIPIGHYRKYTRLEGPLHLKV